MDAAAFALCRKGSVPIIVFNMEQKVNLGKTPQNNREAIRCIIPALTEERRKELIKKAKIVVRNTRRSGMETLKKAQKNEGFSEDVEKEAEAEVQKLIDNLVKPIDELISLKEKEILTV